MRIFFLYLLLVLSLEAFNLTQVEVVNYKVANGKTALLKFDVQKGIEYQNVQVGKKSFQIFNMPHNKNKKYALIPFSYYEKTEKKALYIQYKTEKKSHTKKLFLKVIQGQYEKESIQVSAKKVNPQIKEVKKRIAQEYKEAMKIYATITPKLYISHKFALPINSKITSAFGKARIYNGSLKGYHSGTDFRAKMSTPIKAANDGKVVLVKNRFYSGGTVLLDHGEGIYTCYFHMSKFNVKVGQMIKEGEILGYSGKSGRVTGPHLHFSARINAVQVDPLQFISLMNNNLLKGK